MTVYKICTECPERCVLSSKDVSCGKFKDRIWLDRGKILCRFCKDVETNCPQCAADKCRFGYGKQSDKNISEKLYAEYMKRKGERV